MLPATFDGTLLIAVAAMFFGGTWAITLKMAGPKWRFEHYYFDFAFGLLVTALVAAFTLGSWGDGLTFLDNVMITGKRQLAFAVAAGMIFNLGNMLLVAGVELGGMAVAFPLALGISLTIGIAANQAMVRTANPALALAGGALVLIAVVTCAMAHLARTRGGPQPSPKGNVKSARPTGSSRAIVVSIAAGLLFGAVLPLITRAKATGSELALGPYAIAVMFAIGIFASTFVYDVYFINLPLHGAPAGFAGYFQGSIGLHLLGMFGGALWCAGFLSHYIADGAEPPAQISPALNAVLVFGSAIVAMLWGLLVWREFNGAGGRASALASITLALFAAGLGLVAVAAR